MALGLNVQWGYAGLFNVGLMGFAALGGIAAVLVSTPPTTEDWQAGGSGIIAPVLLSLATLALALLVYQCMRRGRARMWAMVLILLGGYVITRQFFDPAVELIEAVNPAATGYLGGAGLPIMLSWVVGGLFAASAAWLIGKITLGLRSDNLPIPTLGIAEIILSVLRFEEWLTRGVNNVNGLPRPLPQEIDLQQTAIHSPWGRMIRAIRDNETAAEAMGKDVTGRHLQVFVLGSAIVGVAGAMLVTIDGQFTPNAYNPLRFRPYGLIPERSERPHSLRR